MREFMDYVHSAFYEATGWRRDNSYAALNSTPDALLDFQTPRGLRLTLSSLASPNFATSYQLGSVGVVDGSISYLYSSVPLRVLIEPRSEDVSLPSLLRAFRPLSPLPNSREPKSDTLSPSVTTSSLLYGRLYLPQSLLEALVVKRLSPHLQVQFSAVSGSHLRNGGTTVGLAQYDVGRYALEGLASSDGGLLGFRGIYNFGGDVEGPLPAAASSSVETTTATTNGGGATEKKEERERIYGRFSTGGEIYYGTLNKSGGVSLGARFATLPTHKGSPLSATLTINPLIGTIAANYAVVAGRHCSLATRMEFNIYSYESSWAVGTELWRKPFARLVDDNYGLPKRSLESKLAWKLDDPEPIKVPKSGDAEEYAGVLKARLDQNLRIGVLWEGRVKSLLFSLGSGIDLRKMDKPFRSLGLEIQFSS